MKRFVGPTQVALASLLLGCASPWQGRPILHCRDMQHDMTEIQGRTCEGAAAAYGPFDYAAAAARAGMAGGPWVDPSGCAVGEVDECHRRCREDAAPKKEASCNNLAVTLELDACIGQSSCPDGLSTVHAAAAAAEPYYHRACQFGHEGACFNSRRLASHGMRAHFDRAGARFATDMSIATSYGTDSLRKRFEDAARQRRFEGAVTVDGAPFVPVTCHSLEGMGAFGVELGDAAGARVRLVAEVDGSATVAVLAAGATLGKRLAACGELGLAATRLTLDHVRVLEGTARLTCSVAGSLVLRCGPP